MRVDSRSYGLQVGLLTVAVLLACGLGGAVVGNALWMAAPFVGFALLFVLHRPKHDRRTPEERVVDAGVTLGHGWVLTEQRRVWMSPSRVESVSASMEAAAVAEEVGADGVVLEATQLPALPDPWSLSWRLAAALFAAITLGMLGLAGAPAVAPQRLLLMGMLAAGLAALPCVPYLGLCSMEVLYRTRCVARLHGRILAVGKLRVPLVAPRTTVEFEGGRPLLFVHDGDDVIRVAGPLALLRRLGAHIDSLAPREGDRGDVPATLGSLRRSSVQLSE